MFNAREARAMAQRAAETPAALLAVKTAILSAAEEGKFSTGTRFPQVVRLSGQAGSIGLSECIRLLREQGQAAWAEAASQCNTAGYTVAPWREAPGTAQPVLVGLNVRWDSPRSAACGALMMSAEVAQRIAQDADQVGTWARPILEEVQALAVAGRRLHVVRDPLSPESSEVWGRRLKHLRSLDFQADLRPFGSRAELTLSW